jgi:hypothetical protein
MKGKLLGSLAALPLIAVGVVGGMDSANAASIGFGDQLDIGGFVIVSDEKLDFTDSTFFKTSDNEFAVTGTDGFFEPLIGQIGEIKDLVLAPNSTFLGSIEKFLDCSSCAPNSNSFTYELTKATRKTSADGFTESLIVAGNFRGIDNSILGTGSFSTQLPSNAVDGKSFSATITAVPEPTTTAGLLAAGALGAFKAGRRNKKKQEEEVTA